MSERLGPSALVLGGLLLPRAASAHGAVAGLDGISAGALHVVATPAPMLAVLALGLLLGRHWPHAFKRAGPVFAVATAAGCAAGLGLDATASLDLPLLVLALAAAVLTLASAGLPPLANLCLSGAAGVLIGIASTPDPGPLSATVITLLGSWAGANLVLFYAAGGIGWFRARCDRSWADVGLRVIGSWIAAIACLMVALRVAS